MRRAWTKRDAGNGFARPASLPAWKAACILLALLTASLFALPCAAEKRITICVLDSGCNLEGIEGWNCIDDSSDITDDLGHGTRVCALLAACAPDARIVMLKCFDSEESLDGEAAVRALRTAVDEYGADVVNMSWTVGEEDEKLREAVRYASGKGAVLVASAGNLDLATGIGKVVYPAAWDEVIGVGGVDLDAGDNPVSSLWYLSGEAVYVCARADWDGERGSSYAAPRVAGMIAAYLMGSPDSCADDVREVLREAALDLGAPGYDTVYGWGYMMREKLGANVIALHWHPLSTNQYISNQSMEEICLPCDGFTPHYVLRHPFRRQLSTIQASPA